MSQPYHNLQSCSAGLRWTEWWDRAKNGSIQRSSLLRLSEPSRSCSAVHQSWTCMDFIRESAEMLVWNFQPLMLILFLPEPLSRKQNSFSQINAFHVVANSFCCLNFSLLTLWSFVAFILLYDFDIWCEGQMSKEEYSLMSLVCSMEALLSLCPFVRLWCAALLI